jgi:hypothetical protein
MSKNIYLKIGTCRKYTWHFRLKKVQDNNHTKTILIYLSQSGVIDNARVDCLPKSDLKY